MKVRIFTNVFNASYREIEIDGIHSGDELVEALSLDRDKTVIQTPDGIIEDFSVSFDYPCVWAYVVPKATATAFIIGSLVAAVIVTAIAIPVIAYFMQSAFNTKAPKLNTSASLRGSTNTARTNQRLPLILGRYKVTPDIAAQVYTSYSDNEQFLHQLFCFGYKDVAVDLSTLKIGTTPVTKYSEVTYKSGLEISQIYPRRVIETSIGIQLEKDESLVRSTASGTTSVVVGLSAPSGYYAYNDDGDKYNISIGIRIEYKKSSSSTWIKSFESSITPSSKADAWRWSHTITIPYDSSTYDIRVTRTTAKSDDGKVVDYAYWDVMTCFTQDGEGNTYPVKQPLNYALLAMKIRASNQLNGYVDSLTAYACLHTRYFNGTGWVAGETRNPASAVLYLLTNRDANPRAVDDSIIDWDSFEAFYEYCEEEGFTCDAQFTSDATVEELCSQICQSNLATLVVKPSKISIRLDNAGSEAVQLFTPRNAANITMTRSLEKIPSILKCKFNCEDVEYTEVERSVRRNADGSISYDTEIGEDEDSTEITLAGVTRSEHAAKILAVRLKQLYSRQRSYSWQTDIEGLVCLPGDVVMLSTDSFLYGLGEARVTLVTSTYITVDSEFTFISGKSYGIKRRKGDGTIEQHAIVSFGEGSTSTLVVESPLSFSPGDLISFGYYKEEAHPVQITAISIEGDKTCTIQAVDYDENIFSGIDNIPSYDPGISLYPEGTQIGQGKLEIPDKPGIPGAPGSQGPQGPQGEKGESGTPGVSVTSVVREFSVSTSDTSAPVAGWSTTRPDREKGEFIWVRDKVTFSNGTSSYTVPYVSTGDVGGSPLVYFQWAANNRVSPDDDFAMLMWDDIAITWDMGDGTQMAFIFETGEWTSSVTEKPAGMNYLWMKSWNYQTQQWDYIPVNGDPAMSFDLEVNPQTFKLTSRGIVKEDETYSDGYQRIRVKCIKLNTTAAASWGVSDASGNWAEKDVPGSAENGSWHFVNSSDDAQIEIVIRSGVELSLFTVYCQISEIGLVKTFICSGIRIGKAEVAYLGIYPSYEQLTQVDSMSEGDLMVGDHALVRPAGSTGTPYYWNGQSWVKADGSTPSDIAWIVLKNTLYDATHSGDETESMSVIDLFASNFAAYNAFIENLGSHYIKIFKQGAIYGGCFNADGSVKEDDTSGLGFHLSSDGFFQAFKALLQDVSITSYSQDKKEIILATQKGQAPSEAFNVADVTPEYFDVSDISIAYTDNDYKWELDPTVSDDMPVAYNHGDSEKVCLFSTRNPVSGSGTAMTLSFSIGSIPRDYGEISVKLQTSSLLYNTVTIQQKRNGSVINTYYVISLHSNIDVYTYTISDTLAGDEFTFSINKLHSAYIEIHGAFRCELIKTKRGTVTDDAGTKYYVYGLDSPIELVYDDNDYILKNDSNTYPGMDPSFSCYQYFHPDVRYIKQKNLQEFFLNNTIEGNNFCSSFSYIRMDKDDSKKYVVTNIIREAKKATVRYINSYGYEVGWSLYLDRDEYDQNEIELYVQFTNNPVSLLTASLIPSEENNSKYDVGSSTNPYRCVFTKGLHFAVIPTSSQGLSEGDVYVDSNNNLKVMRN